MLSTLEETLASKEDILLTLVLDSSNSVLSHYEDIKAFANVFIERLLGVMIMIVQFSSNVEIVSSFTTDTAKLKAAVSGNC